ncbi:MAG: signal peptidase II [Desulfobulbaceae bacterium]|jgi:signal peptidase II|nr:signal peptidase II [Desulfobulbaceae bacterium]MDY0351488.1 signal peptidase II [Desulfobulbaceae bacterium]
MWFTALILLVVVLDQASKFWIAARFSMYETVPVVPGFFNLTYLTNTGAAFGFLAGQPSAWRQTFFVGIAVAALVVIAFLYHRLKKTSAWYVTALGLIAGGAAGNLIDRVRLGSVIDFLDVYVGRHHWPAFNLADSAITVGVGIFLVYNLFFDRQG